MGRDDHGRKGNNNKKKISQVPNQTSGMNEEEVELSKELDTTYEIEEKPGFRPTGVRRKDK
ncbi:YfhD family protein [Bacillus sp. Marseille-Q3570]|uniref:YfhD family protein n=1 Tax=Bacillus sp. Marseille-Q3570 TaxID=2963522 RepID=UPI0021B814B0|nr:YfhD family protein [Bacillus sp. Marseille-Q3570]